MPYVTTPDGVEIFSQRSQRPTCARTSPGSTCRRSSSTATTIRSSPFDAGGLASAALVDGAELKVYPGAPHGITDTHKRQLSEDLLAFAGGERVGDPGRPAGAAA